MSGDGGSPPSLRDLLGTYEKSGLEAMEHIAAHTFLGCIVGSDFLQWI
jgi:hypothetical protein